MKQISILGSTGSIGTQSLEVIRNNPDKFKIKALSCNSNTGILQQQINEFKPDFVAVFDEEKADNLMVDIPVYKGMQGLIKVATNSEFVINSLVGSVGVQPTYSAIKARSTVALANKESLVTAGELIMEQVKKHDVDLIPVDSEHSAIFQCIGKDPIKRIILTCSGGPFLDKDIKGVSREDALKHPNWEMGNKITIDSATLMNKGLEVIEAHWLFNVDYSQIEVVIHPESIIHSLVEFEDTSVLGQLGWPDMKIPIQYALSYPKRFKAKLKSLDLAQVGQLNFKKPDMEKFSCLKYAYEAGKKGGSLPCVMNAANEIAVTAFLRDKISFSVIPELIKEQMDAHKVIKDPSLNEILDIDKKVKKELSQKILNG